MSSSFLILGCGNMATALVEGIFKFDNKTKFFTYTPSHSRAVELAKKTNGEAIHSLDNLPQTDFIMLACKPQQLDELANMLIGKISPDTVVLSILAGVSVKVIKNKLKVENVARIMPNTPALVGAGVNAFYFDKCIKDQSKKTILEIFKGFSEIFDFNNEDLVDTITPFSGSGPAYYFELTRILTDSLIKKGLSEKDANRMMNATAFGAGKLLVESDDNAQSLRDKVTSKGGVTFEALKVLKEKNLEDTFEAAISAALNRTYELSKE